MAQFSLALLAVFATAYLAGISFAKRDIRWKRLEDGRGLERFDHTDYAFDVADNMAYCKKNTEYIKFDPSVRDWSPVIYAAFQRLFKKGGGTVKLSPGIFMQRSNFEIPSYCCLQGSGMYKTTLKTAKDADPFRNSGAIRTYLTERTSIFDLTQDGNRHELEGTDPARRYGIYTHLANYVWMKNVRVVNNMMYGFDPHGANTEWSYYLVMEDCFSSGNGKDGYTIDQYYYVSLLNSVGIDNDRHGVNVVSGARYVLIKNNKFRDNGKATGVGCSMVAQNNEFGTQSVRFIDNVGFNYVMAGICIRRTFDIEARGNKLMSFQTKKSAAFQLNEVHDVKLLDSTWIKAYRKFSFRGTTKYKETDTHVLEDTSANRKKLFRTYFQDPNVPVPTQKYTGAQPEVEPTSTPTTAPTEAPTRAPIASGSPRPSTVPMPAETVPPTSTPAKGSGSDDDDDKETGHSNQKATADPTCQRGVRNSRVCCPAGCGKCGGSGCSKRMKGKVCCQKHILSAGRMCSQHAAPCIIRR